MASAVTLNSTFFSSCKVQLFLTVNNTSALKPRLYSPYKQRPEEWTASLWNDQQHKFRLRCHNFTGISDGARCSFSGERESAVCLCIRLEGRSLAPLFHLTSDGSWPFVTSQRAQTTLPGHRQPGLSPTTISTGSWNFNLFHCGLNILCGFSEAEVSKFLMQWALGIKER